MPSFYFLARFKRTASFARLALAILLVLGVLPWGLTSTPRAEANAPIPFSENFESFTGTGFAPSPAAGQLDSDYWRARGLSDGPLATFGETRTTGDFAKGASAVPVTSGGVYAFNTGGNVILGVQPSGSDFNASGSFDLRLQNTTGAAITQLNVSYTIWYRNDQPRSSTLNFAYSADDATYTGVAALDFATPLAADALGWQSAARSTLLTGLNIADGSSFYLRWISSDAGGSGSRDEFGIDNVNAGAVVADVAPSVSSTTPTNGATDVPLGSSIVVNFSEPVNVTGSWATISCSLSTVTLNISGGPQTFTLDPAADFQYGDVCDVTIDMDLVTDQDVNDPPDTMAADATIHFSVPEVDPCADVYTPIYDIQGSGAASPFLDQIVTTMGVVTYDLQASSERSGFFLQEPDHDGNAATSDGVFVFNTGFAVNPGDLVRLTGRVIEYYNLTEIRSLSSLTLCDTAQSLGSTTVHLPVPDSMTAAEFWEQYEGMLVTIPETLTVTEIYTLGRYGQTMLSTGGRLQQFTSLHTPDVAANSDYLEALARRSIILDDHRGSQNPVPVIHPAPELTFVNTLRGGDYTASSITGVVNYTFDDFVIDAMDPVSFVHSNLRPSEPPAVGGSLRIAALNLLNYFTTIDTGAWICGPSGDMECRGADTADEFTRQRTKALNALADLRADVAGLIEIENNDSASLQDIVNGLNALLGAGTYAFIDTGTIGTDAIKVGLIYRPSQVTPAGAFAILDSSVDPGFDSSKNRPALAQTFEENATGETFTVVVNHLKSKGSDCNDVGDLDLGDGQGNCNVTRTKAVKALINWLDTDPTGSGDPDFLILGDLNSYSQEDPIRTFKKNNYTNLIEAFIGDDAYSYVFDGQWGYLDYALASADLLPQVVGVGEWHINADEPTAMDYNNYNQSYLYDPSAIRISDHDPVVVGLKLQTRAAEGDTSTPAGSPDTGIFDPAMSKVGELSAGGIGLVGEQLTWVITVTNRGTGTGTNIVITDTLRSELRIDRVETPRGTYTIDGQTVTFTIPSLAPGESLVLRIVTTVLESPLDGIITNTATLSGLAPNGATATATATGIVSTIGALPSTGYPPSEKTSWPATWLLLAGALILVALAGGWALRKAAR